MIAGFISAAKLFATYGTVVAGTRIGFQVAGALTERVAPRFTPNVAGFGDTVAAVLDPLDLTGTRKKKEAERQAQLSKAQTSAKEKERLRKDEVKKRKAAEKKAKDLAKKLKAAEAAAAASAKKAEKAEKAGKEKEAEFYRKQAQASARWARTAQATANKANSSGSSDQQLALLSAAVEIAQNAKDPPMSGVEAASRQSSQYGASIALSLTDSINRDEEPDYDALAEGLDSGDAGAYEDLIDAAIAGVDEPEEAEAEEASFWGYSTAGDDSEDDSDDETTVAGPCCSSCAATGSSCASGSCGVPRELGDGSATGAGIFDHGRDGIYEVDGHDDDDDDDVSGPFGDDVLADLIVSGSASTGNDYDDEEPEEESSFWGR